MKAILLIGMLALFVYANKPTFSQCDPSLFSDDPVFIIDTDQTYTDPESVDKGKDAKLYINGFMTEDIQLSLLELDVYFAGTFLQNVTSPETDVAVAGNPFTLEFDVFIPGFAPTGDYELHAFVWGKSASSDEDARKLSCLSVKFAF